MAQPTTLFLDELRGIRARLFLAALSWHVVRWVFFASVLLCLMAVAAKMLSLSLPWTAPAGLMALVVAGSALMFLRRGVSLRRCAMDLDRSLHLQERISTAVEAMQGRFETSIFSGAVVDDAQQRLHSAPVGELYAARRAMVLRQIGWTVPAMALAGLLWATPDLSSWKSYPDRSLHEAARQEAEKLRAVIAPAAKDGAGSTATLPPELKKQAEEIAKKLMREDVGVSEKVQALSRFQDRVLRELSRLDPKGADYAALAALLEQLRDSGASLGGRLHQAGYAVEVMIPDSELPSPAVSDVRRPEGAAGAAAPHEAKKPVSDLFLRPSGTGDPEPFTVPVQTIRQMLEQSPWPRKYDALIRKYFTSD